MKVLKASGGLPRELTRFTTSPSGIVAAVLALGASGLVFGGLEGAFPPGPPAAAPAARRSVAEPRDPPEPSDAPALNQEAAPGETDDLDPLVSRGRELFGRQCAVCHGVTGDGAGPFAYLMNPRPRNLQRGNFKLATTENQVPSDDDLLRTISRGMPGSAMPPWGHLPLSDLRALVAHVRWIHTQAVRADVERAAANGDIEAAAVEELIATRTTPGPLVVVPPEPVPDDVRWFNGRRVYLEACASCHGADGQPVPEAVKYDAEGYPVPPRSFVNGIFKGGSEGHQLYVRIVKGVKGTPMPASAGAYTDDDFWDLIHYVQSLARAGAQERAQLRQGTFAAPRVSVLPAGPMDEAWSQARPLYVAMSPLWWTEERTEGVVVQAVHDGTELAIRLSWLDPTLDDSAVRHDEFRDAVGIQFSMSSDPPFYMGDATEHGGVNIWMWKADRQTNIAQGYRDVDAAFPDRVVDYYPEPAFTSTEAMGVEPPAGAIGTHNPEFITAWGAGNLVADPGLETPVECLVARGPGTLSAKPANVQFVAGQAVYERGVWYVQMQRTLDLPGEHDAGDERAFKPGDYLPVSFAVWNGAAGDRDGKKNISIWQKLVIE